MQQSNNQFTKMHKILGDKSELPDNADELTIAVKNLLAVPKVSVYVCDRQWQSFEPTTADDLIFSVSGGLLQTEPFIINNFTARQIGVRGNKSKSLTMHCRTGVHEFHDLRDYQAIKKFLAV